MENFTFDDLLKNKPGIPENLEEVFLSNLKDTMKGTFGKIDPEFLSFISGFLTEYGHIIYEFNLKNFTKEEIWRNILISRTEEHKKMMTFLVKFNEFLMPLYAKYSDEQEEKLSASKKKEWKKLEDEMNDEWTTK
jgi:hypothetical protein